MEGPDQRGDDIGLMASSRGGGGHEHQRVESRQTWPTGVARVDHLTIVRAVRARVAGDILGPQPMARGPVGCRVGPERRVGCKRTGGGGRVRRRGRGRASGSNAPRCDILTEGEHLQGGYQEEEKGERHRAAGGWSFGPQRLRAYQTAPGGVVWGRGRPGSESPAEGLRDFGRHSQVRAVQDQSPLTSEPRTARATESPMRFPASQKEFLDMGLNELRRDFPKPRLR